MKKRFFAILTTFALLTGCGGDSAPEDIDMTPVVAKDSLQTVEGEFIYLSDAAVLKGNNFIYGVQLDSLSLNLADSVELLKRDEFHMVPVKVKGKIIQNSGGEGWEELIQIREVLEISTDSPAEVAPQVTKELDKP